MSNLFIGQERALKVWAELDLLKDRLLSQWNTVWKPQYSTEYGLK